MPPLSRPEILVRCLVLAPGLLVAPVFLPTSAIVILMVLGALMTASALVLLSRDGDPASPDDRARPSTGHHLDPLTVVASGALGAVSLAAVATLSPGLGLLVLVAGLLCSRSVRAVVARRWGRAPASGPRVAASGAPAPVVPRQRSVRDRPVLDAGQMARMSDRDLCLAWRASYVVLERSRSPVERGCIVEWRRLCLDEMEARHPAALTAWLYSGARAAGGPDRFLPPGPAPAP